MCPSSPGSLYLKSEREKGRKSLRERESEWESGRERDRVMEKESE